MAKAPIAPSSRRAEKKYMKQIPELFRQFSSSLRLVFAALNGGLLLALPISGEIEISVEVVLVYVVDHLVRYSVPKKQLLDAHRIKTLDEVS